MGVLCGRSRRRARVKITNARETNLGSCRGGPPGDVPATGLSSARPREQQNRWRRRNAAEELQRKPLKISRREQANMTTINNPIQTRVLSSSVCNRRRRRRRPRHLLNLNGRRALLLATLVCLSNCFQAAIAETGPPNHLVPGARLSARLERDDDETRRNLGSPSFGPPSFGSQAPQREQGPFRAQERRRTLDYSKYVNHTSEQISGSGSDNQSLAHNEGRQGRLVMKRFASSQPLLGANTGIVGPPKLVQWSKEAVQYYEGSTLVLSCSLSYSGGAEQGQLKFSWFKQNKLLTTSSASTASRIDQAATRLSIETLADYSFLRLADLRPADLGAYTCVVSNPLGQEDRTTTQVVVNVKLKWLQPIGGGLESTADNRTTLVGGHGHQFVKAKVGQPVAFECNAAGGGGASKALRVRWFRLVANQVASYNKDGQHYYKQSHTQAPSSRSEPQHRGQRVMDEAQIKASLLQMDTVQAASDAFLRVELINKNGDAANDYVKDPAAGMVPQLGSPSLHNDSSGIAVHQLRWRIETNSGSSASSPFQQHEIYSRLVLDRLDPATSGLYECEVANAGQLTQHESESGGLGLSSGRRSGSTAPDHDRLKRFFGLFINGK